MAKETKRGEKIMGASNITLEKLIQFLQDEPANKVFTPSEILELLKCIELPEYTEEEWSGDFV